MSFLSGGRTVTWIGTLYFALPFTLTLFIGALAGAAAVIARLLRLRSVGSAA